MASGGGCEREVEEVCVFVKCDSYFGWQTPKTAQFLFLNTETGLNWKFGFTCRGETTGQCVKQHRFWARSKRDFTLSPLAHSVSAITNS